MYWQNLSQTGGLIRLFRGAKQGTANEAAADANATLVVRRVLGSLPEFRLRTDQQESEWHTHGVSFLLGASDCDAVCANAPGGPRACARDWFAHIDRCPVAQVAFPAQTCAASPRPYAPAHDTARQAATVSAHPILDPPACDARPGPGETRLCPCVPPAARRPAPPSAGHVPVGLAVRAQAEREAAAAAAASSDGGAVDLSEYSPALLLHNLQAGRGPSDLVMSVQATS